MSQAEATPESRGPWTFVVDGPPVPKARPRMTRTGHVYTPAPTLTFEAKVRAAAKRCGIPRLAGGVQLVIRAFVSDLRAKDWDNLGKAVSDALNPIRKKRRVVEEGVAWFDDVQVTHATVIKRLDREQPRLEVTVAHDPEGADFCAPAAKAKRSKKPVDIVRKAVTRPPCPLCGSTVGRCNDGTCSTCRQPIPEPEVCR